MIMTVVPLLVWLKVLTGAAPNMVITGGVVSGTTAATVDPAQMDPTTDKGEHRLYWLQQQGTDSARSWTKHTIDESYSQIHAVKLADLDGDGVPELLTGKRYRGHAGNDPGSYDPLVVYYYKLDRKKAEFTRYAISVNGLAGAGTQFVTEDLDGDGDVDVVTAGKTGVTFFENLSVDRVPKATRERQILLNKDWPFPGEGKEVKQEDGPPVH